MKNHPFDHRVDSITRRGFLETAALAAGAPWINSIAEDARDSRLRLPPNWRSSRIVEIRSNFAVTGRTTHEPVLGEMIAKAVTMLTDRPSIEEAWTSLLKPTDVIGLKFNHSGERLLGTSTSMADVLIRSLTTSGFSPSQIVCIESPGEPSMRWGTTQPLPGFSTEETDFGSGRDQLARVLDQVSAIINVPFLKHHNIAGVTCALKNLSHALVKHPGRYHANGCSPFIGDIIAIPRIQRKIRLNLVNALRVVFDHGPEGRPESISEEGLLIASVDPVATDSYGLSVLNDVRTGNGLPKIASSPDEVRYLREAHVRGIGTAIPQGWELVRAQI